MQKTTNVLLAVIAVSLLLIVARLYTQPARADSPSVASDYGVAGVPAQGGYVVVVHDRQMTVYFMDGNGALTQRGGTTGL